MKTNLAIFPSGLLLLYSGDGHVITYLSLTLETEKLNHTIHETH